MSAPQSVQLAASAPDDVPARHGEHNDALPAAYVPFSHGFCSLDPSHEYPDGHSSQPVRDIEFPPEVNDPAGHVLQPVCAGDSWYCPRVHSRHAPMWFLVDECRPTGQSSQPDAPTNWPGMQSMQ